MDEPTAALGVQEQAKVLQLIRDLKERGIAIIVTSHNLEHVFSVADRIVVLRGGRVVGSRRKDEPAHSEIVHDGRRRVAAPMNGPGRLQGGGSTRHARAAT